MSFANSKPQRSFSGLLDGSQHRRALLVYIVLVVGHFSEHLVQMAQVFAFGWAKSDAGGLLGLIFSSAAENELLHLSYNSFQLTGLILLAYGFRHYRAAHTFWMVALVAQIARDARRVWARLPPGQGWANVLAATLDTCGVPPIDVFDIGGRYFVLDVHHRVSVARQLGHPYIEAYVTAVKPAPSQTRDSLDNYQLELSGQVALFSARA